MTYIRRMKKHNIEIGVGLFVYDYVDRRFIGKVKAIDGDEAVVQWCYRGYNSWHGLLSVLHVSRLIVVPGPPQADEPVRIIA